MSFVWGPLAIGGGQLLAGAPPPPTPGTGSAGVATLAMRVESGARVTMTWRSDVMQSWSGLEQRTSTTRWPQLRFNFKAVLSDQEHREVMSELAGSAPTAPIYLLGLAHEDMTVVSSSGTNIVVSSLTQCDWAQPGQRIVAIHPASGAKADAVIQSAVGVTIVTDPDVSAIAIAGARVLPALQVYLEPRQSLARYLAGAGEITLDARNQRPFTVPTMGLGGTVNVYETLAVWDAGIHSELAEQPLLSGSDLVDYGARVTAIANFTRANWHRALRIEGRNHADWQWFKRFLDTVRGRSTAFLLPSGRPDLVALSDASTATLVVEGGATGQPNYVADWFPSLAHRRLKLVKTDGTFAYRTVLSATDNADGTQDLVLNSVLAGALARVELLEQVRLDSDEVTVEFMGPRFVSNLRALVVQR